MTSPVTGSSVSVGVDLGGTASRFVALDDHAVVVADTIESTPAAGGPDHARHFLEAGIAAVVGDRTVRAVGVGASGPIDAAGIIRNPATLPAFTGLDVGDVLRTRFGVPCVVDNDAVAAGVGEALVGAGREARSLLCLTLGTGVGVALLRDGRPVRGGDGVHPEAGHLSVWGVDAPCYCGRGACFEQLASRARLERLAVDLVGGSGPDALETAGRRARAGDAPARALFDTFGEQVGGGLADLLTAHRPDLVVVGGSAARFLPWFGDGVRRALRRVHGCFPDVDLVAAQLGTTGGAVGAALLAAGPDRPPPG